MFYILVGLIVFIVMLPIILRNQTRYRKEQITKKAKTYGIDLDLTEKPE